MESEQIDLFLLLNWRELTNITSAGIGIITGGVYHNLIAAEQTCLVTSDLRL